MVKPMILVPKYKLSKVPIFSDDLNRVANVMTAGRTKIPTLVPDLTSLTTLNEAITYEYLVTGSIDFPARRLARCQRGRLFSKSTRRFMWCT